MSSRGLLYAQMLRQKKQLSQFIDEATIWSYWSAVKTHKEKLIRLNNENELETKAATYLEANNYALMRTHSKTKLTN